MRNYTNTIIFIFWTTFSFGQIEIVVRENNETAKQFAERLKPKNSTLAHKVLETNWNKSSVIIVLYDQIYKLPLQNDSHNETNHRIEGYAFFKLTEYGYSKVTFGTIDTEGGDPIIETVFFANADKDEAKELIIIASWEQRHYDVSGTLYGTYVFDTETIEKTLKLAFLDDISKKLDGGCECSWRDGTRKKAKFKTALEIKHKLVRLGYKQE